MAKELLRMYAERHTPEAEIVWTASTRSVMSDGQIYKRLEGRWADGHSERQPWKLHARLKPGIDPEQYVAERRAKLAAGESENGWREIERTAPAPFLLSLDEIMQAVEDDENTGFCRECGAQAYGVEPDASNYKCEECGAMAVYGAQELLLMSAGA